MAIPREFLDRAADPSPELRVKFCPDSDEEPRTIKVEHCLGTRPARRARDVLDTLAGSVALGEFLEFYKKYDGVQLCRTFDSRHDEVRPLLELLPVASLAPFTDRYRPGGDLAWTIDHNKSKSLYRGSASWIAFAQIDSGPACLTMFLEGDHAESVFLATPQPWFNILRPVAKGFHALLNRIAEDPAAFLRLVRATVTLRGVDGHNYGLVPIEYQPSRGSAKPPR